MSAVRKYKRIQVLAKFEFPVTDKHLNLLIFALQSKLKVLFGKVVLDQRLTRPCQISFQNFNGIRR